MNSNIFSQSSRTGKIARLPYAIREQVNLRLQNGEKGISILHWLNSLPDVCSLLQTHFAGRPISPSNLTEWKQGGYRDWIVAQQTFELAADLFHEQALVQPGNPDADFTPKLAHCAAIHYAAAANQLLSPDADAQSRFEIVHQLIGDISRLRRSEIHDQRLDLDDQRRQFENQIATQRLDIERQRLALREANLNSGARSPTSPRSDSANPA